MNDTITALLEHGIRLKAANQGNHKTVCPNCSHSRKKKNDPCLSVTVEADGKAVWNCHHCGWSGAVGGDDWRPAKVRKTYQKPARVESPQRPDQFIEWFQKRAISTATIERFGLHRTVHWFPQTNSELPCIAFPYEWQGELRNVKYRSAEKYFTQEKGAEPVLFNADSVVEGEDLIWAEGEMDVLSLIEAGFTRVVTLPNGAPATDEEASDKRYEPLGTHWEALSKVSRFLIATDMDAAGERLAQELARRLGKDRCWRVSMPNGNDVQLKDANECLVEHGAKVLGECVAAAKAWPIDGLYEVSDFASEVREMYAGRGPQPQSTGFPELDYAFKFIPGQFIVVTGIPNHGKSRFIDQVAVQTIRADNGLWGVFSPETGEAQHITDLCEIWAGAPFHPGPTWRMSEEDLEMAMAWLNERIFFIGSLDDTPTIDWILDRARAAVLRYGIKHVLIDPYNEVEASRPPHQTETEFVSQLISKCKHFAKHHDVTVWMIVHPTKLRSKDDDGKDPVPGLYDLSGSAHWRNKADAGLVVYRDDQEQKTWVISRKIRRQPICGSPGAVAFTFNGSDRRFQVQSGSYERAGAS